MTSDPLASLRQLEVTSDGVYVGLDGLGEFGLSKQQGKILWHHPARYAGLHRPLVLGGDVITEGDKCRRIALRTGDTRWKTEQELDDCVLATGVIIGASAKEIQGRDVATGKLLWKLPLADAGTSYMHMEEQLPVSDGESVWLDRNPVVCVTKGGRERWHRSQPFTGGAVYADSRLVVTTDSTRLLAYTTGALPPLPVTEPEKQALAQRLTSQYEILDDSERKQLLKLTPYAFPLLLARYVEWAKAFDTDRQDKGGMALYTLLTDVPPLLLATCRKEDTDTIVSAWSKMGEKSGWRNTLESILMAKGEPSGYIPVLIQSLRRLPADAREGSSALTAVSHSTHPDAVAFMLEALHDPKAAPAWRKEAFVHLADTGGEEGIRAVRAARHSRAPVKPWFDRINLAKLGKRAILGTKTDSRGRTWILFQDGVLGNYSDLFIVQKDGARWKRPLFTGVWTAATFHHPAPKTFRGIPLARLIATEWIKIFPDDPTIHRDTDGDGLTDLVEARLGTNPNKADTDGDGLSDLVDPCPNAAPRSPDDAEKIVAACIEARFFEENRGVPAILSAPGVKPFEVYGYNPVVLWEAPGHKIPMGELYGGGVNIISFNYPDNAEAKDTAFIRYDRDKKIAHTLIRRYSGGLNGDGIEVTLRKIGDEWFVIELQMRYIS